MMLESQDPIDADLRRWGTPNHRASGIRHKAGKESTNITVRGRQDAKKSNRPAVTLPTSRIVSLGRAEA